MFNPASFFKKIWSYLFPKIGEAAAAVVRLADAALPIVKAIAAQTPTRADDEIIALFERFAVPFARAWLALPVDLRGAALAYVGFSELQRRYPQYPVEQLRAAVELALTIHRAAPESAGDPASPVPADAH